MPTQYALVIEDDANAARAFGQVASSLGYQVNIANTISEARASLQARRPELMLIDVGLPDGSGLAVLEEFEHQRPDKVIVVTGDDTSRTAIECVRLHATDMLNKPFNLLALKNAIARDAANASQTRSKRRLRSQTPSSSAVLDVTLGETSVSQNLRRKATVIAATDYASVIIDGDTGVDKIGVAQWLHRASKRQGSFVHVNCLAEGDDSGFRRMFGEEDPKTGGVIHRGYVEQASGGTLLLDNVSALPKVMRSRLAHVLDCGLLMRHNGFQAVRVKLSMVGVFRDDNLNNDSQDHPTDDFHFRLAQFRLRVPSLHQRGTDAVILAQAILNELNRENGTEKTLSQQAKNAVLTRRWSGNTRELKHALSKAFEECPLNGELALSTDSDMLIEHNADSLVKSYVGESVWHVQKDLLFATLAYTNGDKSRAAKMLGISLKTLYNRLEALS